MTPLSDLTPEVLTELFPETSRIAGIASDEQLADLIVTLAHREPTWLADIGHSLLNVVSLVTLLASHNGVGPLDAVPDLEAAMREVALAADSDALAEGADTDDLTIAACYTLLLDFVTAVKYDSLAAWRSLLGNPLVTDYGMWSTEVRIVHGEAQYRQDRRA